MKIRSRLLTRILAFAITTLVRLLFRTCRKRYHLPPELNPYLGTGADRHLYCIWHDQILMTVFSGRPQHMAGLVSLHQDGSLLADALQFHGILPVRGSTSRGGAQAMRQMLDVTRDHHIAITPDGPRGPRHVAKNGIVFLASHARRAIIPVAYTCRRFWRIKGSWTDMMVPKPFTTIYLVGGAPLEIPRGLSRDDLDRYTALLQAEMDRLQRDVEAIKDGTALPPHAHDSRKRHAA